MGEVRKLGANDLQIGEGTVVSAGGKTVQEVDARHIPVAYGTANDAVTGYDNVVFSVDNALSAWVDVRAYGAAGDGVTDDTTAIQAALDAAAAAAGVVLLPAGTYVTTSALSIPGNVTLQGVRSRTTGSIISYTGTDNAIKISDGYTHTTVRDVSITGGGSGAVAVFVGRPDTLLENVHIYDFQGTAGVKLTSVGSTSGPWNSVIRGLKVQANTAGHPITAIPLTYGVWFSNDANRVTLEDFVIAYTGIASTGSGGIYIDNGAQISIHDGDLESCYIAGSSVWAMYINGGTSVSVRDVYVEANSQGIWAVDVQNLILSGIYMDGLDVQSTGIRIVGPNSINVSASDCYVTRIFGSQTDIQFVDYPVNVQAKNCKTDDGAPYSNNAEDPWLNIQDDVISGISSRLLPVNNSYTVDTALTRAAHNGSLVTNYGAGGAAVNFTLWSASAGDMVTIVKAAQDNITITKAGAQTIEGNTTLSNTTAEFGSVTLWMMPSGVWIILHKEGTWA